MTNNGYTPTELVREVIHWVDSRSVDGWWDIADVPKKPAVIKSVGYVVQETKKVVCLAGSVATNLDQCACTIVIPKVCIRKRRIL